MNPIHIPNAAPAVLAYMASGDDPPMVFTLCFFLFISALFWFRSYTGLARGHAFLASLGSVIAGGFRSYSELRGGHGALLGDKMDAVLSGFAAGAIILFLAALALRLWGRWVGDKSTPEERLPGLPGIRAWFCFANVTVGIAIAVCAWLGYDFSPVVSTAGIGGLLAAAPLLRMESPAAAPAPMPEDMSAEREKIVSMIESGKLTAEEGAELLQALGATRQQPAACPVALTGGQRLMLVGAAMVTLGFFLPWFTFDSNAEVGRMMNQVQKSLGSAFAGSGIPMPGGMGMPEPVLNVWRVSVNGGGVAHGLGVAALALALAAALLPYFALALEAAAASAIRLLCLGAGGLILLYLLSQNVRAAGIGLMVVMAGYVLQTAGLLRDRRSGVVGAGQPV